MSSLSTIMIILIDELQIIIPLGAKCQQSPNAILTINHKYDGHIFNSVVVYFGNRHVDHPMGEHYRLFAVHYDLGRRRWSDFLDPKLFIFFFEIFAQLGIFPITNCLIFFGVDFGNKNIKKMVWIRKYFPAIINVSLKIAQNDVLQVPTDNFSDNQQDALNGTEHKAIEYRQLHFQDYQLLSMLPPSLLIPQQFCNIQTLNVPVHKTYMIK